MSISSQFSEASSTLQEGDDPFSVLQSRMQSYAEAGEYEKAEQIKRRIIYLQGRKQRSDAQDALRVRRRDMDRLVTSSVEKRIEEDEAFTEDMHALTEGFQKEINRLNDFYNNQISQVDEAYDNIISAGPTRIPPRILVLRDAERLLAINGEYKAARKAQIDCDRETASELAKFEENGNKEKTLRIKNMEDKRKSALKLLQTKFDRQSALLESHKNRKLKDEAKRALASQVRIDTQRY